MKSKAEDKRLLICVVKNMQKVEQILSGFMEIGIYEAVVIDGRGIGEIITKDISVFGGLRAMMPKGVLHSHVIMSLISRASIVDAFALIKDVCSGFECDESEWVFTLPVDGMMELMSGSET